MSKLLIILVQFMCLEYCYSLCVFFFQQWFVFFRHLDFFEMMRNDDEKILAKKFEGVSSIITFFPHKNLNGRMEIY